MNDLPPIQTFTPEGYAPPEPQQPGRRTVSDLFVLAQDLHVNQKNYAEAERLYLSLLNRYPNQPYILFMLGTMYAEIEQHGLAIVMLERAISRGASGAGPWMNLGNAWKRENRYEEALKCYETAAEQPDGGATVWTNLATLYVNEGQPEKAVEFSERALGINPDDDVAHYNRSIAWLELGRFEDGFRDYHAFGVRESNRRRRKDRGYVDSRGREVPMWDGSPGTVDAKAALVIYGEQGIGDEVMFASCIPDVVDPSATRIEEVGSCRPQNVFIECDARLADLFRRSFPWATVYGTTTDKEPPAWPAEHEIDARIPMGSLPMFYRKDRADFPGVSWLIWDPVGHFKWRVTLDNHLPPHRLKVGLLWIAGRKETRVELRSMDLSAWQPILDVPGCAFVSLQPTTGALEEATAHNVKHWPEAVCRSHDFSQSYDDTAAMLSALDLFICVNSSATHLAGGLGVECWTLTPSKPSWPFGLPEWCGDEFVWAKSVRQFRQRPDEPDWAPTIQRVAAALRERVGVC